MLTLLLPILLSSTSNQPDQDTAVDVVKSVTKAAEAILETLDEAERKQVSFAFDDAEQRLRWSNLPTGIFRRAGLRWGDLDQTQRDAIVALFRETLSSAGVQQILDNMESDEVLNSQSRGRNQFGRDEYYFSFLGQPSTESPWMWQFGGHHLAINATIVGPNITLAPSFTGGQPMDYRLGERDVRQLADEEDRAYAMVAGLTEDQRKAAVVATRYADLKFGPGKGEGAKPVHEGICAKELNDSQQKQLIELIGARIGILNPVHARPVMERILAELDQTWFSWSGPLQPGSPATFRVQGPTLLMEYSPQRLGGDPTAHVHAMYRDPTNDYGHSWTEIARLP